MQSPKTWSNLATRLEQTGAPKRHVRRCQKRAEALRALLFQHERVRSELPPSRLQRPWIQPPERRTPGAPLHQSIVIVTGLPRSGTSLAMQMLAAGGLPVFSDSARNADLHNPAGYFEAECVKTLATDSSFLGDCVGKVVKIVSPLILTLQTSLPCSILFLQRDPKEVLMSQQTMIGKNAKADEQEERTLRLAMQETERFLDRSPHRWLRVRHRKLLTDPKSVVEEIEQFLSIKLDHARMLACVRPDLYRAVSV